MGKFLEVQNDRGVTLARAVLEKIDSEVVEAFAAKLYSLVEKNTILLLDLSQVQYVFSEFLELLLQLNKKLKKAKGKLALCGPQATVREILFTTRFDKLMPIFNNEAEALHALT